MMLYYSTFKVFTGENMYIQNILRNFFPFEKIASVFLFILLSGVFSFALSGGEVDLAAGDSAFAAKDYAVAASFYTRHLKKLKNSSAPQEKIRECYERLMDSLLSGSLASDAEKFLAEYKKEFPDANKSSVELWQGEICLQKGEVKKALLLYEKLLSALHGRDPRRLRALSSYARTLELSGRYNDAAKACGLLREQAGDSPMGKEAMVRQILNFIHGKNFDEAEKQLAAVTVPPCPPDIKTLLQLYFTLQKNGLKAGKEAWEKFVQEYNSRQKTPAQKDSPAILPLPENKSDPLLYLVAGAYGDAFHHSGEYSSAISAYRTAYQAAENNKLLFQILTRIIRSVSASGNGEKAALLAEKQVNFFHHPLVDAAAKLRIAAILAKNGRSATAAKLYESIFHDLNAKEEQFRTGCRNYFILMIREKKTADGIAKLRSVFKKKSREMEGELLIASTLAEEGFAVESIVIYENLPAKFPQAAEEAFYKGARLALSAGKKDSLIRIYDKLLATKVTSPEIKKELSFLEGKKYLAEGKNQEAEKALEKYVKSAEKEAVNDLPEAISSLAILVIEKKEYQKAIPLLQTLVKKFPSFHTAPLAVYWLIHIHFILGNELEAEKGAWLLAGKYPSSPLLPEAMLRLCRHYTDKGAYDKASSVLDQLSRMPEIKNAGKILAGKLLCEKGDIACRQGKKEEALLLYRQAAEKTGSGPVYQAAECKLAQLLYETGKVDEAIEEYARASVAAGSDPLLTFAAQGALGNILLARRSQDQESLKQALASFLAIAGESTAPGEFRAESTYKAGRCHELLGEKAEAEKLYKQLLYMFPAKSVMKNPAVSVWCVKAAECLIDSAAKTPVLSAFENARSALHYLYDAGLINRKDAENRFETLKKMKFNP